MKAIDQLRQAMRSAQAAGLRIRTELFGVSRSRSRIYKVNPAAKGVCVIGAFLIGRPCTDIYNNNLDAARVLHKTENWVRGVTVGFDGKRLELDEPPPYYAGYKVGQQLRKEFIDV